MLKRKKGKKLKSLAKLKKELWKVFSLYIRKRDRGVCFTCGQTGFSGFNYHAGHFIPKSIGGLELYFNEDNVHGQCARCNLWLAGDQYNYGLRLGKAMVKLLQRIRTANRRSVWTREQYIKKIAHYKKLIK